jgi:arsenite methyltransferase
MTTQTPSPTHQAVQEYYGKLAREDGSCCDTSSSYEEVSCCTSYVTSEKIINNLYPAELLAGLPADVAKFTAGSGDPISLAKLKPGETVLDLGSGSGLDCFLAARQVGGSGHVIGVDMTPEMLARASSNATRLNSQNVEFRQGYLESLPVDDQSVDIIISNCVINLSPDKSRVISEMVRVLKPGGRIAVSDMVANHPIPEGAGKGEGWCNCTAGALTSEAYYGALTKGGFINIQLVPDVAMVMKAIDNGQVRLSQNVAKDQMLADLQQWEKSDRTMVVPYRITASKPA